MTAARDDAVSTTRAVLAEILELDGQVDWPSVHYQTTPGWDSLVHMAIVAGLEEAFGIAFTDQDVLDLDGYAAALAILRRHGVPVDG